jgi:acyl dehydratase
MSDRTLSSSPSMLPLFARAGISMIPGASRLPWVGGGGGDVPEGALTLEDVEVDRDRLAAYDRVCGFRLSDRLPATYPHMLAFPLHLALMTSGSFPLPAIGLVHIANRIEQRRPLDAGERFSIKVWATPIYPHPRGRQFMIRTEVHVGTELVWTEASLNLARGRSDDSVEPPPAPPSTADLAPAATWRLPGDLGRRYGSVSGDLNPIHVHPLSAKLFGFPSAIAHGMWTKARCLAALDTELPESFSVEVAFKRPIILPATVHFAEVTAADAISFGVRSAKGDNQHLDGLVEVLS